MAEKITDLAKKIFCAPYIIDRAKSAEGVDGRMIAYLDKDSCVSEQYRILQARLYTLSAEKQAKVFMITSSREDEGKTTTCCNLAFTISFDTYKKVVLVDADLRKPDICKMLNIQKSPGFSDIILGKASLGDFTKKPAVGNLYVIPAGSDVASPIELLREPKARSLIEDLKRRFDFVMLDTPPVLPIADSRIIAPLCDAVILVVKAGATSKHIIGEGVALLEDAHVKPAAFVMTSFHTPFYMHSGNKYYRAGSAEGKF